MYQVSFYCGIIWTFIIREQDTRTVARKFSIGGLCVSAGGLKKTPLLYRFHVSIWGDFELCLGWLSPYSVPLSDILPGVTKTVTGPVAPGALVVTCIDFFIDKLSYWKLAYAVNFELGCRKT